ncbi:hypothetical protein [Ruania halotolerans]|uniref:hypothetical protein n=1 Tax=Ruania halotolerans TaxID=2897773 RepID=UPI001E607B33|nr:hypothetical protein [Ruania halotolerans]UFU05323.1 hypothetical protein LQF10_12765 [Ruania halotolerans]
MIRASLISGAVAGPMFFVTVLIPGMVRHGYCPGSIRSASSRWTRRLAFQAYASGNYYSLSALHKEPTGRGLTTLPTPERPAGRAKLG